MLLAFVLEHINRIHGGTVFAAVSSPQRRFLLWIRQVSGSTYSLCY
jgi:hypothetical protein